jgi:hypothetical protein
MVGDANELAGYGVHGSQDIVSLAAGCGTHEQASRTPHPPQERAQHEVRSVYEKHRAFSLAGFGQSRLKLLLLKKPPVF